MNDNSYYVVSRWMATQLGLTGNELHTYAIIFGFSQDGETEYKGSTKYLMETLNISKPTAMAALNGLESKGLIKKRQDNIQGVYFNRYSVNLDRVPKIAYQSNFFTGVGKNLTEGRKESLPSNIKGNIEGNIEESICISNDIQYTKEKLPFSEIIDYLNEKTGKHYRPNTSKTQTLIRARFREKYTFEDFKKVIDTKCSDWLGTDMEQYLTPDTLFSPKFEKYLNQTPRKQSFQNSPQFNPNTLRRDNGVPLDELFV